MPEITVSDTLYQHLTSTAGEDEIEDIVWELLYQTRRNTVVGLSDQDQ